METISENVKLLIVGYLTGDLNQQDTMLLMQWINASADNREHFNTIKASWELVGKEKVMEQFNGAKSWDYAKYELNNPGIFRNITGLQLLKKAATWLLLLGIGSIITIMLNMGNNTAALSSITEIIAPLGAKSIINLPDGTKVWLNADSKLIYNAGFNGKDRLVELVGEAYFHVKTDASKPFIVKTSDVTVRALGTRFNVKAYPKEKTITATLEEGKIDVQLTSYANQKKVVLIPNENIVFYKTGKTLADAEIIPVKAKSKEEIIPGRLEVQAEVKTILYTSWKEEKWVIESEPLSSLIPKLERKFNLNIAFSDKELRNYKFTGSFKNETIEQILEAMSFTAPIDYSIDKDKIVLRLNTKLKEKYTKIITPKN